MPSKYDKIVEYQGYKIVLEKDGEWNATIYDPEDGWVAEEGPFHYMQDAIYESRYTIKQHIEDRIYDLDHLEEENEWIDGP